jgi:hypothetical protein
MWHAWERRGKCTRFWWVSPNEEAHSKDRVVDGRMGSEWMLGRWVGVGFWSGFSWLRMGACIAVGIEHSVCVNFHLNNFHLKSDNTC